MHGQLLPLRLLGSSSGFLHSSRGISVLSKAFPFKLKYFLLCSRPPHLSTYHMESSGVRALSSRPMRPRSGARDHRRGNFRVGSVAGQGKSLIEDEAELSDWISDLKTDSFRVKRSSDSDDSGDRGHSLGSRDRDGDRVRIRDGKGRGRGSLQPVRGHPTSSKRQRDSNPDNFSPVFDRRLPRGSISPSRDSRSSQPKKMLLDSDLEEEEEEEDFGSRRRRGLVGTRGGSSSSLVAKRGGRDSDSSFVKSRGRTMPAFEMSEEENEVDDDDVSGFEDGFLGGGDDRKVAVVKDAFKKASSFPEPGEGGGQLGPSSLKGADSYLSQTRFEQCSLSPLSLKGIKAAGYERMTVVQEATLPVILKGKDVLAKAKTGTGKTVAFLLPAIEVIAKLPSIDRDQKRPPINVLVICPTRELASQAATEANTLLKFHPSIGVQVVIGGTRLALEQKRMQANPCQILVATPGRLRDHIENTPGFATRLMGVKILVLDEADHLLDMGFRKDIEKIVAAVPKQRQTLLFSATVPEEVRQICHIALKRDHDFINTVEEGSEETNSQVRQMLLIAPLDRHFSMLYGILTEHISEDVDYKVLVFCTTAMVTKLVASLLSELNLNVREIHSRKPQSYRTRVSDEFRKSKGLILVTSDVSARGVDYPDVTLVIQVGVPADREQYIHRLGRTGRKGNEGKGILLLAPWEEFFLSSIKDLPISNAPLPLIDPDTKKKVERGLSHVEMKNKESAYQAWLGYYNSNKNVGRDKGKLVALANEFSRSMGLDNPPAIPKLVLGKMGLRNVPGLRAK